MIPPEYVIRKSGRGLLKRVSYFGPVRRVALLAQTILIDRHFWEVRSKCRMIRVRFDSLSLADNALVEVFP